MNNVKELIWQMYQNGIITAQQHAEISLANEKDLQVLTESVIDACKKLRAS